MRSIVLLVWAASLVSALEFHDQKNFFYPDPNASTPPTVSYSPPATPATPNPTTSQGGTGTPPASCGAPPSGGHHTSDPSPPAGQGYNPNPPSTVSPPYTCTYWKNHPSLIWGMLGWSGSVGKAFGVSSVPGLGPNINLLQALSNTRTDGYGEICRQGTAALLNSMADAKFPYTTAQVRNSFAAALSSNDAAAAQARLFKRANEPSH
ncbi:protodermal factor 1-like [Salvia miltiorrhiza]|uniref:protodermal factor 1-like n=1 Tax=Salvia miltiorrhiza TaxID=226208 RepID=UPI0025ABC071|nr:protodermal factor 1-like [Salvia miltiorrhiza]